MIECLGKFYVGSSCDIFKRWDEHMRLLRRKFHHSKHLQRLFDKYGSGILKFYVLEYVSIEKLLNREDYFIQDYFDEDELLNSCFISGSRIGTKCSAATKRKISENNPRHWLGTSGPMGGKFGKLHPQSKTYKIKFQNNKIHLITGIRKFCKENGIVRQNFMRTKFENGFTLLKEIV